MSNQNQLTAKVVVCRGRICRKYQAEKVWSNFEQNLPSDIELMSVPCLGACGNGAMVVVEPEQVWYSQVHPDEVAVVIQQHLINKSPVKALDTRFQITIYQNKQMNVETISNQLCQQYDAGKRQFNQTNLQKANLENALLSQIDLSNSDLDYANLKLADLNGACLKKSSLVKANFSRANLVKTDFTEANLTGANLTGANIIAANFAYANLSKANFSMTKLIEPNETSGSQKNNSQEITKCHKVNFYGAILTGAFFIGVNLSFANLERAVYDDKTNFAANFDPKKAGMVHITMIQTVALDQLVAQFNHSFSFADRYLGGIATKYFHSSRPDFDWLNQFNINSDHRITFTGTVSSFVSAEQLTSFQEWIDGFNSACSKIIKNFPAES